ncbi:MAG TPA: hypothetical protein VFL83_22045 [Anaeromyxobacter sp.]|nr:hypothetical protein [Anaeromyxobacter sp.]
MSDDALELLRSSSGLSVDEEGRFLHRGEPIAHARTLEVLWRSLEPAGGGRWLVRVGRESAYVAVAETPFIVRGLDGAGGSAPPALLLSDGSREPLDPATVRLGADGVLRCTISRGRPARFARAAQIALGMALEEDPPGSQTFVLAAGGRRWRVAEAPATEGGDR